jgi:hypothetical protein
MHKKVIFVALALMATTACTDLIGPPAGAPLDEIAALASQAGTNGGDVEGHILRQSPSAPALETYQVQFWAERGKSKYVRIRYVDDGSGDGTDDERPVSDGTTGTNVAGDTFLSLYIPKYALEYHPDGTPIEWGERVLITITVDPQTLLVSFEPFDLTFQRWNEPWLYLSYNGAELDYDRDGDVDRVDAYIEDHYLRLWDRLPPSNASGTDLYQTSGSGWNAKAASQGRANKTLNSGVSKFSDVAVSW